MATKKSTNKRAARATVASERPPGDDPAVPAPGTAGVDDDDEARMLVDVMRAGIEAVRPERCLRAALNVEETPAGRVLRARDVRDGVVASGALPGPGRTKVLAIGKCAVGSALALREILGEDAGPTLAIDRERLPVGLPDPASRGVERLVGDHPAALEGSLAAGRRALEFVRGAEAGDLLVVCLSGGASALCELPVPGVDPLWLREVPISLMRSGAGVRTLLGVRMAMSALKGGGLLARVRRDVTVLVLVLSDVEGDEPSEVGGAPFHPPSRVILRHLGTALVRHSHALPHAPSSWLETEGRAHLESLLDVAAPLHVVVATNALARKAAREYAASRGVSSEDLGELSGPADVVAKALVGWARRSSDAKLGVMGGEAVVEVTGDGVGGPCLETVARCAVGLAEGSVRAVGAVDTDGLDGPSGLAGAVLWPERALALGARVAEALAVSDSRALFADVGGLDWGATGANASDLRLILRA